MKLTTAHTYPSNTSATAEGSNLYRQYFIAVCAFYLVMAGVLAVMVQYGVMDEDFHLEYSRPFVKFGFNTTTLYRHVPPTGVSSHLWFAFWMWLFPGINFIGLRLITCAALLLLAGVTCLNFRAMSVTSQQKILAVSLFMLVCPYFFLSVSTVMTEGPALLFLFAGLLLLALSRFERLLPFFMGSLLLGLTTIARFYYIPLLPTLFIVLLLSDWQRYDFKTIIKDRLLFYAAIGVSLLPLIGLILLWGGLTPPFFEQWSKLRSGVSFNAFRPLSALAIMGVYVAPFVLLNVSRTSASLIRAIAISLPLALVLALLQINLFHDSLSVNDVFSGPIEHGLAWIESRGPLAFGAGLFVVYSLSLLCLVIVIQKLLYFIQTRDFSDKGLVFSVVFVGAFITSQAFVGGNHPFFDRYLIHPWPFIGYIIVRLFPQFLNPRTYLVLAAYTTLSVMILIKWGINIAYDPRF